MRAHLSLPSSNPIQRFSAVHADSETLQSGFMRRSPRCHLGPAHLSATCSDERFFCYSSLCLLARRHICLYEEETSHDSVCTIVERNGTLARLHFLLPRIDKTSTSEMETLFFLATDLLVQLSITAFHPVIITAVYPSLLLCVISASLRIVQCTPSSPHCSEMPS